MIREDFLQQNAFVDEDAYSSYGKQFRLLDIVLQYDVLCRDALAKGAELKKLFNIPSREAIGRAKTEDPNNYAVIYDGILANMRAEIAEIAQGGEEQ